MTLPTGIDWVAVQRTLHGWVVAGSGLNAQKVIWAQQDAPRPAGAAIVMRLSNDAEDNRAWLSLEDNPLVFAPKVVTSVDPTTNIVLCTGHGLLTGDGPVEVAGTLPSPLAPDTNYWVIAPDANHLQFASTYVNTGGGQGSSNPITAIDLTTAPAGTFTVSATSRTVRAGQELKAIARSFERVTLELHCHAADGVGTQMASAILQRVRQRRVWPSQKATLRASKIGVLHVERVRTVMGIRDAVLFEPRAYLDISLCIPCEDAEAMTVIHRADITNDDTGTVRHVDDGDD